MPKRVWVSLGVVAGLCMIAAFAIIAVYPIPHVRGGWCQFTLHHYRVETVTRIVMYLDVVPAIVVIVAAGMLAGRPGRALLASALTAVPVGLFLLITLVTYMGRIECAF